MSATEPTKTEWSKRTPKELAYFLIEDFKTRYAGGNTKRLTIFERYFYFTSISVILLGILIAAVAVLVLAQLGDISYDSQKFFTLLLVFLPILSSGLVTFSMRLSFKEKYSLRATVGRIEASLYYNQARAKYTECKNDMEFLELSRWLTGIMKIL